MTRNFRKSISSERSKVSINEDKLMITDLKKEVNVHEGDFALFYCFVILMIEKHLLCSLQSFAIFQEMLS